MRNHEIQAAAREMIIQELVIVPEEYQTLESQINYLAETILRSIEDSSVKPNA